MNPNDYDEDGNNIVPCPICLSVHCPSKEGGKCPEEDAFVKAHTDPYEAIGSNLRVHHPVQPKTQVEKWGDEMRKNRKAIENCCGGKTVLLVLGGVEEDNCPQKGTEKCSERGKKNNELAHNILSDHEKNKTYLNRHPTRTFADDKCNCAEISCKVGCKRNHTHKTFSCEKCNPKVTLLDKIKKLLWKYLEK